MQNMHEKFNICIIWIKYLYQSAYVKNNILVCSLFLFIKIDFLYVENNCFICVVKIKNKNKLSKITDLYSMQN